MNTTPYLVVDDYILINNIGKGNFGDVYLTKRNRTNEYYATKRMDRSKCEQPHFFERLSYEIYILKIVHHPNIIKYIDCKKSLHNYYLITEFANGGSLKYNLWKFMSIYKRPFTEDIVQYLMKQIVDAVKYLHYNKIIHRDLKLDNILLNYPSPQDKQNLNIKSAQAKIIDFGFAKILTNKYTFTTMGTPFNMDPIILENANTGIPNSGYDEKADIWSLGTLCYEMVVGHTPFVGTSMEELYQKVKNGNYTLPMTLSEEIVSFINEMLQQEPKKRADASKLINHPFLVNPITSFHHIDVRKIQANYLPGGMINMTSKQPEMNEENNNNIDIWSVFNEPGLYQGPKSVQIEKQNQNQIQNKPGNLSGYKQNSPLQKPQQQQMYYYDQSQNQMQQFY